MENRVQIPHTDIELGGEQFPSPAWWKDDEGFIWMRCNCGELAGLNSHDIGDNGEVNPSIYHDWGCGWHVYGTLEGWQK